MRTLGQLSLLALLLAGCASSGYSPARKNSSTKLAEYQQRATQPTPPSWRDKARWEFAIQDAAGNPGSTVVFEVTDVPANTCISGDWRKLKVLRKTNLPTSKPAYSVNGRNLQILLSTDLCDAYDELKGEFGESGFVGIRLFYGLMSGTEQGKVVGRPIGGDTH